MDRRAAAGSREPVQWEGGSWEAPRGMVAISAHWRAMKGWEGGKWGVAGCTEAAGEREESTGDRAMGVVAAGE